MTNFHNYQGLDESLLIKSFVNKINEPENKKEHDEVFSKIIQKRKDTDK